MLKEFIQNLNIKLKDYCHLLFKSAADNHLRIQHCVQNKDGAYVCSLKFNSYTELKNYQKKIRKITISLSGAVAMVIITAIVSPMIFDPMRSSAANFQFLQTDWSGGASDVAPFPNNTSNQTGWAKYYSKDATNVNVGATVTLSLPVTATTGDASYASAPTGMYLSGNAITLKKLDGASCTSGGECKNGLCSNGLCDTPCGQLTVSSNGLTYGTVAVGSQCWLDRNLGASQVATGINDASAYGWLYQWGRLTDGHQIRTSGKVSTLSNTDVPGHGNYITRGTSPFDWRSSPNDNLWQGGSGINNPCPTGFHVPTHSEWSTAVSALGITSYSSAYTSALKLTAAGVRGNDGTIYFAGDQGNYWSSTVYISDVYHGEYNLVINGSSATPDGTQLDRSGGESVRCIKN